MGKRFLQRLCIAHAALGVSVAAAQDDEALGFGNSAVPPPSAASTASATPESDWSARGALGLQSALRLERSGDQRLGKLRQLVDVRLEYSHAFSAQVGLDGVLSARSEVDFAYLVFSDAYDRATYDVYAWQVLPRESFLRLHAGAFELATGEQVVNLGQSEMLGIFDAVNPRDLREPLLTPVDDLRIPLFLTRASLSTGPLRFEALVVHETNYRLVPPPLGEFSPFRALLLGYPALNILSMRDVVNQPIPEQRFALDASQFHARVTWSVGALDLALHAASTLDNLGTPTTPPASALSANPIAFPIYHSRYTLLGHSGAATLGAFVLRWELAAELARPVSLRSELAGLLQLTATRASLLRGFLGLTWVPSVSTNASLEVMQAYALERPWRGSPAQPLFPLEAPQLAFHLNQHFWNDRLYLDGLVLWVGVAPISAVGLRGEFGAALGDAFHVALGGVVYLPGKEFGIFYGYERNDRVYCNLRWDFSLR